MLDLLREGLLAIGALPPANTDGFFAEWRALFQRADLTAKEVRLLEHMARKMIQRGGGRVLMAGNPQPFEDVVVTDDGFSIPELKWRELVFIGAVRRGRRALRARSRRGRCRPSAAPRCSRKGSATRWPPKGTGSACAACYNHRPSWHSRLPPPRSRCARAAATPRC